MKTYIITFTHLLALLIGFAGGIYALPILTAPASVPPVMLEKESANAIFSGEFTKDLPGSDLFHWGEGTISLTADHVIHQGSLSPGPDYKLYLLDRFVQHEDEFLPIKDQAIFIGDIKQFDGFILDIPNNTNIEQYNTVVIWCESFSEFISAAQYR